VQNLLNATQAALRILLAANGVGARGEAELRSAWTLRLRSGQAREGARPHAS